MHSSLIFFAEPLMPKNLKIRLLALGDQVLTLGQTLWHIPGVTGDWTFCFLNIFSLMNYMSTVGHFVFSPNQFFSALGAPSMGPI